MSAFADMLRQAPVVPAPMCGYSDRPWREVLRERGAGLVCTEMLSIEGLARGHEKTFALMAIEGEKPPVSVQIFGTRPEAAAEAAKILEDHGATVVDFNMGCPARKVVGGRGGAALLKDPDLAGRIVGAVARAISIPLTVKMRWSWDEEGSSALEVARICEAEGAAGVCLHARSREAGFGGAAKWEHIAELKAAVGIPVIGNGDVRSSADALAMREQTHCDAVMIGRALIGNPWLLSAALEALETGRPAGESMPAPSERFATMLSHGRLMAKWKGEARGLREFRKHAVAYLKGLPKSRSIKNELMKVETVEELERVLDFRF
jgi:tRNA-dihydrouridine synthase B